MDQPCCPLRDLASASTSPTWALAEPERNSDDKKARKAQLTRRGALQDGVADLLVQVCLGDIYALQAARNPMKSSNRRTGAATVKTRRRSSASSADLDGGGELAVADAAQYMKSDASLWTKLLADERARAGGAEPDMPAVVRHMQALQRAAEAAARAEPLQRTPKQLRALVAYVGAAAPFEGMAEAAMLNVARCIALVRTGPQERIIAQGSAGSAFYVVLAGEYSVYQAGVSAEQSRFGLCASTWSQYQQAFWPMLQRCASCQCKQGIVLRSKAKSKADSTLRGAGRTRVGAAW
jgi:hypothetical protein